MLYGDGEVQAFNTSGGDPSDVVFVNRDAGLVYNGELRFGLEAVFRQSKKSLFEYYAKLGLEGQYWADIGTIASGISSSSDIEADFLLDGDLGLLGGNFMLGVRAEF